MSVIGKLGTEQSVETKIVVVKVTSRGSKHCYNIAIVYGNNEDFIIVCMAPLNLPEWFSKQGVNNYLHEFYEDSSLPICTCEISFNQQEMSKEESFARILSAEKRWGFKPKTYPKLPYQKEDGYEGYCLEADTGMEDMVIFTNASRELLEAQVAYNIIRRSNGSIVEDAFCILKAMGYTVVELGDYGELVETYGKKAVLSVICHDGWTVSGNEILFYIQEHIEGFYAEDEYDEEEEE